MLKRTTIAFTVLATLLGNLEAATLKVPKQFASVQAAVDAAASGDEIVISKGTYAAFAMTSKDDIAIRGDGDVTIDGSGGATAISIANSSGITIEKLSVTNAQELIFIDTVYGFTVRKCNLSECFSGLRVIGSRTGRIEKNTFKNAAYGCVVGECVGVVIRSCELRNIAFGIAVAGAQLSVESNSIVNVASGIQVLPSPFGSLGTIIAAQPIVIHDNVIENDSDFTGVFGDGPDDNAIHVEGPNAAVVITDNQIKRALNDGISIDPDVQGSVVARNVIKKAARFGIRLGGDSCALHDNEISNSGSTGVNVTIDAVSFALTNNTVEKSGSFGFLIDGAGGDILSNTASDNADGSVADTGMNVYHDNSFE